MTTPYETWKTQVIGELAGTPFEKLETRLREGVVIEPLYVPSPGGEPPDRGGVPGLAPYTRGRAAGSARWTIAPRHVLGESAGDAARVNHELLTDLAGGADGVFLELLGAPADRAAQLEVAFRGVDRDAIRILVDATWAGPETLSTAAAFFGPAVTVGLDPAAATAFPARSAPSPPARAALLDAIAARGPDAQLLALGSAWHRGYASAVDELAFAFTGLIDTLRALDARGLPIAALFPRATLSLAVGRELFLEVAKLRAARVVASRVGELIGASGIPTLHAETSRRTLSRFDRWNNLLRVTTQTFAAAIGGAEVITAARFDETLASPGPLGARLARNTSLVLLEEAALGQVQDPAGGSYFVEQLTDDLAEKTWARLQGIEASGGLFALIDDGRVHAQLGAGRRVVFEAIARRKEPITGVTEFPLATEPHPGPAATPRPEAPAFGTDAEGFEALRDVVEAHAVAHVRPALFIATLGPLAEHQARRGFAENFFGILGLRLELDPGAPEEHLATRFAASGAKLVCLAGADARYETQALTPLIQGLRARGAEYVYLAGRPGEREAELRAAGVDAFIHVGVDVFATLHALVTRLGGLS